ncbi:MAG: protein translocase subunit SecD [Parcubacteria group bacterium CG08_land_8_20_14_0_20_48_21]|nr:MAG: protein-export membrane protein SecD [Parcubacteria group bacterium CG2_30_48_51]PIS32937.1 MAG: protein translocase subunit SecD [Parcubacteria group bacterium CG08_land_8_20_14_0_20_48_21]PIW79166.1 MAG: protein translocase subunit SecD [Parcubacteria group bacterium CG_4_8_14_3_um_filter_48_16]PIY77814.1 MAG: protein translocase subunit SecD [Parcubacteria group bacterium CG_4_10_14_0_8_um_filter_48_154]PIZ77973.1 MAG: protein translocase subunit SecD [bacterium CG_4_10_14_0_2_um_fil
MTYSYGKKHGLSAQAKRLWAFFGIVMLVLTSVAVVYPQGYNTALDILHISGNGALYRNDQFHLGLDLQGGAHLVYEADTSRVFSDAGEAVDGVRDVIERRVNSFGVAEPLVQTTKVGDSWRIIVELAGVFDVNEAIQKIGETPLLEFKVQNNEPPRILTEQEKQQMDAYNADAKGRAQKILDSLRNGTVIFDDAVPQYSEDTTTVTIGGKLGYLFADDAQYASLVSAVENLQKDGIAPEAVVDTVGYHVVKLLDTRTEEKEVFASHLLICWQGLTTCAQSRTKEEAQAKINLLKAQATPENFSELAKENSDDLGSGPQGGVLGSFRKGAMVPAFENAVFNQSVGTISDVVESPFGYHLILKTDEKLVTAYQLAHILITTQSETDILGPQDEWQNTDLTGKHLRRAVLEFNQTTGEPEVSIEFGSEGKKLFEDITDKNIGKPVAIFLDGIPISTPTVQQKIVGGKAVITGQFTVPEAKQLVQRLNTGALPVPITLVSQQTVGATLGSDSLAKSLQAGMLGILFVVLFMILYYRLSGILAVCSLGVYAVVLLALFKLIPITLTLAGIAGFILSLGMAVDANVLIFERIKEELRRGRSVDAAIDEGFVRAWPSIRDGNVSTLITCFILFTFTTSIVQGFAITLGIGVVVSMFSAIVITRIFMKLMVRVKAVNKPWLFGGKSSLEQT